MTKKRLCYCHGSHHCHPDQITKLSQKFKKQISAEINQLKKSETSILNSKNVLFHDKQNSEYLKIGNYIPNISDLSIKSSTSTCSLHDFCFFRQTYDNKLNLFSFEAGCLPEDDETLSQCQLHAALQEHDRISLFNNHYKNMDDGIQGGHSLSAVSCCNSDFCNIKSDIFIENSQIMERQLEKFDKKFPEWDKVLALMNGSQVPQKNNQSYVNAIPSINKVNAEAQDGIFLIIIISLLIISICTCTICLATLKLKRTILVLKSKNRDNLYLNSTTGRPLISQKNSKSVIETSYSDSGSGRKITTNLNNKTQNATSLFQGPLSGANNLHSAVIQASKNSIPESKNDPSKRSLSIKVQTETGHKILNIDESSQVQPTDENGLPAQLPVKYLEAPPKVLLPNRLQMAENSQKVPSVKIPVPPKAAIIPISKELKFIKKLYKNSISKTHLAIWNGDKVQVKIYQEGKKSFWWRSIEIHQTLNLRSESVISFIAGDVYENEDDDTNKKKEYFEISEYSRSGNLDALLRTDNSQNPLMAVSLIDSFIIAVKFLHSSIPGSSKGKPALAHNNLNLASVEIKMGSAGLPVCCVGDFCLLVAVYFVIENKIKSFKILSRFYLDFPFYKNTSLSICLQPKKRRTKIPLQR